MDGFKPVGGTAIEEALLTRPLEPADGPGPGGPPVRRGLPDRRQAHGRLDERRRDRRRRRAQGDGRPPVRVFSFGIGDDVNTHLLDRLTETDPRREPVRAAGRGPRGQGVELLHQDQHPGPRRTSGSGSRDGARAVEARAAAELPDLFRGEQLVVLGRYSGSGDTALTLAGSVNGTPRVFTTEATFPRRASGNDACRACGRPAGSGSCSTRSASTARAPELQGRGHRPRPPLRHRHALHGVPHRRGRGPARRAGDARTIAGARRRRRRGRPRPRCTGSTAEKSGARRSAARRRSTR